MLDKNERQFFTGEDTQSVIQSLQGTLYQHGIGVTQTGPAQWGGRGQTAAYGMVPKVSISLMPAQGGFFVDVRVSADFETNGLVIFIVAWLFFFPVAIILGFLGYQDWQNRQMQLSQALWAPLAHRIAQPPAPAWGPQMGAPPQAPPTAGPPPGWGGGQA